MRLPALGAETSPDTVFQKGNVKDRPAQAEAGGRKPQLEPETAGRPQTTKSQSPRRVSPTEHF